MLRRYYRSFPALTDYVILTSPNPELENVEFSRSDRAEAVDRSQPFPRQ